MSEQRQVRRDLSNSERREIVRRFLGRSLRHYAAMALIVAAAGALNGSTSLAVVLVFVALVLVLVSFRIRPGT